MKRKISKRRNILKGVAIGTAWTAPVIQSVVIPSHAATTDGGGEPGGGTTLTPTTVPPTTTLNCPAGSVYDPIEEACIAPI